MKYIQNIMKEKMMSKLDKRFGVRKEFTATEIYQIREDYLNGKTQLELAEQWSVSQKTIAFIIKRYSYAYVGVPDNYDDRLEARMGKYWDKRYRRKEQVNG
jgi:hypothetical protein